MTWNHHETLVVVRRAAERLGPRLHPASERPAFVASLVEQWRRQIDPLMIGAALAEVWPAGTDLDQAPPTPRATLWACAALAEGEPAPAPQYGRARLLAEAHGHQWAAAAAFYARAFRGRRPSWADVARVSLWQNRDNQFAGVIPAPDDRGHVTHTTGTGRTSWDVAPDGTVEISIDRPGPVPAYGPSASITVVRARVAPDGTVSASRGDADAEYFVRHVQALEAVLDALGVPAVEEATAPLYEWAQDAPEALIAAEADLGYLVEEVANANRLEGEARAALLAMARDGVQVELLPYAEPEPYAAQLLAASRRRAERLRRVVGDSAARRAAAAAAAAEIDRWEDAAEAWGAS
jgi:hypothetical protein